MEHQRYQEVLEEHARLTHHPVRAFLLLLIAIVAGLMLGPTRPGAVERFFLHNFYLVE